MQGTLFHDLHELMVCGEVAGLFEKDEVKGITNQLAEELTPDHTATSSLWDKFVQVHVRQEGLQPLHIVSFIALLSITLYRMISFTSLGVFLSEDSFQLYKRCFVQLKRIKIPVCCTDCAM